MNKKISLILILAILLTLIYYPYKPKIAENIKYGVTFSPTYTQTLGLDWKSIYINILDDLKVRNLRIPTYWSTIEPREGEFDYSSVDFMLDEANKRDAKVILVVGMKQPRWPECHIPTWAKILSPQERHNKTLKVVENTVNRYKDHAAVTYWQIENEPLFKFRDHCDKPNAKFLKEKVELVRQVDPSRPLLITDSGELSLWTESMQLSDMFGTTLYRTVYNKYLGYLNWTLPPQSYTLKSDLIKKYFAPRNQKTIIAELQAEPWSPIGLFETPIEEQLKVFSLKDFQANVDYAKKTGFDEIYLWGVEWWYFAKEFNHPEYLEYAKVLFNQ